MRRIRVLLVDDHPVVRAGLAVTIARDTALEVVGEAGDGIEALQMVSEMKPDVVLMDLRLPGLDGIQATEEIRKAHPDTSVIILSAFDDDVYVERARRAGAAGYLFKEASGALICHTIKAVYRGEPLPASSLLREHRPKAHPGTDAYRRSGTRTTQHPGPLTPREMDVLRLLVDGLTNKTIAQELSISEVTAKKHVQSIIAKLDASDRTEAAVKAIRAGIVGI